MTTGAERRLRIVAAAAICMLWPLDSTRAQLIEQRIEGNRRTCLYRPDGLPAPIQRLGPDGRPPAYDPKAPRQLRIDAGASCPSSYDAHADRIVIPSLARLIGQSRRNGRLTCIYRYLRQDYTEDKGTTLAPCPATPGAW